MRKAKTNYKVKKSELGVNLSAHGTMTTVLCVCRILHSTEFIIYHKLLQFYSIHEFTFFVQNNYYYED